MSKPCEICPLNRVDIPEPLIVAAFRTLEINAGRAGVLSRAIAGTPEPADDLPDDKLAQIANASSDGLKNTDAVVTCWLLRHIGVCPESDTYRYRHTDFPSGTI
ncbi:MAG TPA: hypothetical protein VLG47_03730 [Candidatus Saccharimonadales bacterium]|nr:hypothetical protein [Candidatus Saccharimonadales bacterium]